MKAFCKGQRVTGVETCWQAVSVLQPGLKNVMRLLTCYSRVGWGNNETVTREALSWSTVRAKTPQCASHSAQQTYPLLLAVFLNSVSSSSSLMNSWRRSMCDGQNERVRKRWVWACAPTSWEDQNQECLHGDGSLTEPPNGGWVLVSSLHCRPMYEGRHENFAWFLFGLLVA